MSRALLAIHGFSGHPEEIRFVGETLANGLNAHLELPLLPGHGTDPADLAHSTHDDWYQTILASYERLASQYEEIVVLGNSLGAALALKLAAERPVAAVIGIAIPRTTPWQLIQIRTMIVLAKPFINYWQKPKAGRLATEQIPGYTQRAYEQIPLRAMEELIKFQRNHTRPSQLARVTAPTLLVVPHDPFVPESAAPYFLKHLGSRRKQLLTWDDRYHLVVQGERKAELTRHLLEWLQTELNRS